MSKKKSSEAQPQVGVDGVRIPTVFDLEIFDYVPKSRLEQKKERLLAKLNKVFDVFQRRGTDGKESGTLGSNSKEEEHKNENQANENGEADEGNGASTAKKAPVGKAKAVKGGGAGVAPANDPLLLEKTLGEDQGYVVDVRDAGMIIRACGLNINESQLMEIIEHIEDPESTGQLSARGLKKVVLKILLTNDWNGTLIVRDDEARIIQAFEVLDKEKRGYLDAEFLREVMTGMGDRFSTEEISEMISASAEPETGKIFYEDFAALMATDEEIS